MTTVFIVSAPSGSGKSTLVRRLLQSVPRLQFSISYTTREPRGGELQGKAYYFTPRTEFETMIAQEEFLEHAEVFGNYYGTHRRTLAAAQAAGEDLVLDIDVQGARQLKQSIQDAVTIFILPPSRQILEARLRRRSEDAEAVIARRLRAAAEEIKNYRRYDYVLVNDDLERASETLESIVKAERVRRQRMETKVLPILDTFE